MGRKKKDIGPFFSLTLTSVKKYICGAKKNLFCYHHLDIFFFSFCIFIFAAVVCSALNTCRTRITHTALERIPSCLLLIHKLRGHCVMARICEICGIVTTNGKCFGLISLFSVCVRRSILFKKNWLKLAPDPRNLVPAFVQNHSCAWIASFYQQFWSID